MKKYAKALPFTIIIFTFLICSWLIPTKSQSYEDPSDALFDLHKDLLLIPAYKLNDEALFFFIKDRNSLGTSFVHRNIFGWKAGMLTSSPINLNEVNREVNGFQAHGDNLIYGLIRNTNNISIEVNEKNAKILNLNEMLSPKVVKKYHLEDLSIWYFKSDLPINEGQINTYDKNSRVLLYSIDL